MAGAQNNGGDLGFEAYLFKAADKLGGNLEPSDYKHAALGPMGLRHPLVMIIATTAPETENAE